MKRFTAILLTLVLALSLVPPVRAAQTFPDVPADAWYAEDVAYAVGCGLINGREKGYEPDGDVTLAECIKLAAVLHQQYYGNEPLTNGEEVWYSTYEKYARQNGISISNYRTMDDSATRGQMAHIFAALPDEMLPEIGTVEDGAIPDVQPGEAYAADIYRLYRAGIMAGKDANKCYPADYFKRSELARIIRHLAEPSTRVPLSLKYVAPAAVSSTGTGNTPGNWANRALFAQEGDWVYYQDENDMLSRIKTDGTGKTVLAAENPRGINLVGDYIYYISQSADQSESYVKRVRKDGAGSPEALFELECKVLETADNDPLWRLMRVGDKLVTGGYTIDEEDRGHVATEIVVSDLEGGSVRGLVVWENWNTRNDADPKNLQACAYDFTVDGNTVYYSTGRYNTDNFYLCKINLDGSGFAKLAEVGDQCHRLQVVNGWLYYLEGDSSVKDPKRMNLSDGTIEDLPLKTGHYSGFYIVGQKANGIRLMNVIGNDIYYSNTNQQIRCYNLVSHSDDSYFTTSIYFGVTEDYLLYWLKGEDTLRIVPR